MTVSPRLCELCRRAIALDRLEVLPETHRCSACANKSGSDLEFHASTETTTKQGSLKKGSTGITGITWRRKPNRRGTPADEGTSSKS